MDNSDKNLSVGAAVMIGHLLITIPVLVILASVLLFFYYRGWTVLGVVLGTALGWLFWSLTIPVWRRWAIKNGADADELERAASRAALTWPKGSLPAKTEIDFKKDRSNDPRS